MSSSLLPRPARRVAVVGSGVAGLVAAHVLARESHVLLLEADTRLGGHADTHEVDLGDRTVRVDTGFIVHNDRTYPTLLRLFAELGVATQDSDMSMSVRDDAAGLEYAGARRARGLFPTWRNATNASYLRMLVEVKRFHRAASALLAQPETSDAGLETLGDFADRVGFSAYFRTHFLEPVVAAVWSCDPAVALRYPARYLFAFLDHHGMLTVFGSPTWRTVVGGSARYVEKVAAGIQEVRTASPVSSVHEGPDGVVVTSATGTDTVDAVVLATHPSAALAMLADPTALQRQVLGALPYSRNTALLHTDESVLPRHAGARASWNYWQRPAGAETGRVLVTYDLTRLMRLDTTGPRVTDRRFLVTLGGEDLVDRSLVIDEMDYEHPLYTPESVAAQRRLPEIASDRIAFAGAYHGWGFHEDGALSGLRAAEHLGASWDRPRVAAPLTAATT
ncbi:NAD(P)/FAD-dependent oxidoreductase [Lapillicoccus jejuensis]|uniref:Putative NAD/FAD-binding protein n=1 Tax=Lapillicoccus jejuensis TaxID=402171 RepID=A0A542DZP2_9MICO|nr:FAD-dependent oxidoreductase [Lapillicoccus jejuensis]TQJ08546.1 putative NAD/FAD-binding protein [Lapillicoccus jejuensis]